MASAGVLGGCALAKNMCEGGEMLKKMPLVQWKGNNCLLMARSLVHSEHLRRVCSVDDVSLLPA